MRTNRYCRLRRKIVALICLLTVTLLYAPLGGAAWAFYKNSCCTSGQCKIPAHHHHRMPAAAGHMDCGHDMPGMMMCTMNCCQDSERTFASPIAFVIPAAAQVVTAAPVPSPIEFSEPGKLPQPNEPLSPPPRLIALAA